MNIEVGNSNAFLFEVYVYDFDDNYHRTSDEPSSELEREAKRIRRRYKNIGDYMRALAVYSDYMAHLIHRHGGPDLFKIKLKNDAIDDFVPARPRMKNNEVNKSLIKNKILVSRVNVNKMDEDVIEEVEEAMSSNIPEGSIAVTEEEVYDRVGNKLLQDINVDIDTKKLKEISNVDYLEEYFRTKNVIKKTKEKKETEKLSITEIMNGDVYDKIKDTEESDDVVSYRGQYMKRNDIDELEVYKQLATLGWDHIKIMRTMGISKRVTNILKEQEKDKKKKKKKKQGDDDFLVHIVTDGGYDSYEDFEKDMLNMTSDNVFK